MPPPLAKAGKPLPCATEHRRVRTSDGVLIAYTLWRRPAREIILLAPGFWRVRLARENLYLATHFVRRGYDVAVLDFRGHGDSGGAYTFGPAEAAATCVDCLEPQAASNSAPPIRSKVMSLIWISSSVLFRGRRPS